MWARSFKEAFPVLLLFIAAVWLQEPRATISLSPSLHEKKIASICHCWSHRCCLLRNLFPPPPLLSWDGAMIIRMRCCYRLSISHGSGRPAVLYSPPLCWLFLPGGLSGCLDSASRPRGPAAGRRRRLPCCRWRSWKEGSWPGGRLVDKWHQCTISGATV